MTPDLLATAYGDVSNVVTALDGEQLARPSRCAGWVVADMLFHLLLDAQRALVTFATPTDRPPDVDRATYWAPHKPGAAWAREHEAFVRQSVAAYSSPEVVVRHWNDTSAAAVRAAQRVDLTQPFATQGHVLTAVDFMSTLVVEAVVHHLDLTGHLADAPDPSTATLRHVRDVFDEMLGTPTPPAWSDVDYILAASGRAPVPADIATALGTAAGRFPLLG